MALPQTEKVGLPFTSQPHLLLCSPLTPPCSSCSPCTQAAKAVKEAPRLAPHPFHTQQPSHLSCQDCNFSLFASPIPPPSALQLLLVPGPGRCKVFDQGVHILRGFAPNTLLRRGGKESSLASTGPTAPSWTPPYSRQIYGQGQAPAAAGEQMEVESEK